ncbi:MAG: hypothetical protein ACRELB_14175, partial [Polyangiaceae bacterium]
MPPAMRLDRFAELSARLASGQKKDEVLASAQVEPADWELSQQFWLGKMAEEAGRRRFALSQKYGTLYRTAIAKLDRA